MDLPARSGISQARARLGEDPVEGLFRISDQHWGAERYPDDDWQGLQVLAIDGDPGSLNYLVGKGSLGQVCC